MAVKDLLRPKAAKAAPEDARGTVERLAQAERKWGLRQRELLAELAELEAEAGAELLAADLEGRAGPDLAGRIATLRTEADMAGRTALAARTERLQAIPARFKVEAAALHAQAATLKADVVTRQARTQALLAQLREHEGVPYAAAPYWGPDGSQGWYVPASEGLAGRAQDLERQATQTELRPVTMAGAVVGDSPLGLVDAIMADPLRMGPTIADVLAWAEHAQAAELKRRARIPEHADEYAPDGTPLVFELTWQQARIDPRSRVLPPPPPDRLDQHANWPAPRTVHVGNYETR